MPRVWSPDSPRCVTDGWPCPWSRGTSLSPPEVLRGGGLLGATQVPVASRGRGDDLRPFFLADSKGLSNPAEVEALREKVYASLEAYCKHKYPEQPGR